MHCASCGNKLDCDEELNWVHEDGSCDNPVADTARSQRDLRDFMARKGYSLGQIISDIIRHHHTNYQDKGEKPDDPGWFGCTCETWYGYWSDFEHHVGEEIAKELTRMKLALRTSCCERFPRTGYHTTDCPQLPEVPEWLHRQLRGELTVREASERLTAHADWLRNGPDGSPPYTQYDASYQDDLRLVLSVISLQE